MEQNETVIKTTSNTIMQQLFLLRDTGLITQEFLRKHYDSLMAEVARNTAQMSQKAPSVTFNHIVTGETTPEEAKDLLRKQIIEKQNLSLDGVNFQ